MFNEAYAASTLPLAGTAVARSWDNLYHFLFWISVFFFVLVVGAMIYFAVAYRKGQNQKPRYITGNHLLETIWIVIPTLLLMVIFGWGYMVYSKMTQSPPDSYEIKVIAKQWLWTFQYPDGRVISNELFVPANRPVKLIMSSEDVLHSFFIPNFRVKQDVVPGMYTSVWFEAKVTGKHQVFCAEYCGGAHSRMLAKVVVLDDKQWAAWEKGREIGHVADAGVTDQVTSAQATFEKKPLNLVQQGEQLFKNKGCVACHSTDGTNKVGPTMKGLFGSTVEFANGATATADENYLRESMEAPQAKIVKGYTPTMPTFKGLINETEMNALITFIKSVK